MRCNGIKSDGNRCSYAGKFTVGDLVYCGIHQPKTVVNEDSIKFYSSMSDKTYYPFSNFFPSPVTWRGMTGSTTEHLFQAAKFDYTTEDEELNAMLKKHVKLILAASSPTMAKSLGRARMPPIRTDWESVKIDLMRSIVRAKVQQHVEIKALLLSTGDKTLVEAAPSDFFWGIGRTGRGRNELGKAWMDVRDELQEE